MLCTTGWLRVSRAGFSPALSKQNWKLLGYCREVEQQVISGGESFWWVWRSLRGYCQQRFCQQWDFLQFEPVLVTLSYMPWYRCQCRQREQIAAQECSVPYLNRHQLHQEVVPGVVCHTRAVARGASSLGSEFTPGISRMPGLRTLLNIYLPSRSFTAGVRSPGLNHFCP